jgi:VCBS repeat-containing protein
VGAGAGTIAYVKGDLETVEAKGINDVYEATKKAVKQLELGVTKDTKDAMSAVIIARDAQDKKITITLKGTTEEATKISIRVGMFGNETKSQRIYEQIKKNLE